MSVQNIKKWIIYIYTAAAAEEIFKIFQSSAAAEEIFKIFQSSAAAEEIFKISQSSAAAQRTPLDRKQSK
jgi:hypothetical protein